MDPIQIGLFVLLIVLWLLLTLVDRCHEIWFVITIIVMMWCIIAGIEVMEWIQ